jgi:hypothetical protein
MKLIEFLDIAALGAVLNVPMIDELVILLSMVEKNT